ncbi:hypothetical protein [Robertmurraya massiliosenegalensis]|uniref:hypothetical protein n=1 Tax=Robertmurraya massiliosenegalensis TaxID=1287657 RepID=UPI0002F5A887|nr:hypothetical protein [Robertmurraya massiliosenegalensis]
MNISGMARNYIAKYFSSEDFLVHVSKTVERQLQEWNTSYEVIVMKVENYHWNVKIDERYYELHLTEEEIKVLQKRDPYALDRRIWKELKAQGLPIKYGDGNYLDLVL